MSRTANNYRTPVQQALASVRRLQQALDRLLEDERAKREFARVAGMQIDEETRPDQIYPVMPLEEIEEALETLRAPPVPASLQYPTPAVHPLMTSMLGLGYRTRAVGPVERVSFRTLPPAAGYRTRTYANQCEGAAQGTACNPHVELSPAYENHGFCDLESDGKMHCVM